MINTGTVPKKVCTRPTVVKSRQKPRKEATWHLPDALFSMSANRGLTPDEVREVDALIRASVEELEIFKKGCYNFLYNPSHLRNTGATIAAYLKLKPVIDNKPMTPTARRNYESNLKYGFPMGHFNPEFEETPLFPTLSDIFHRTNGYKRSPLKIMTSSEIKETVGMADAKENRSLRKKFAKAVEESFSLNAARQVRSVSRGSASTQCILNVQSHLYLSGRVCGHINSMIAASIRKKEGNSSRLANYQQRLHNLNLPRHLRRPVVYGSMEHVANTNPVSNTAASACPGPSNLSQELQAARRSFLAVGSQSVSTVVNIPQIETQTADGRLVPSGNTAGNAADLADPQSLANVMRSLNQPMRPRQYPNTILRLPVSALQRQDGQVGVAQIPGSTTLSAPIGVGPASYIILPSHPVRPSLTSHGGHVMSPSLRTLMPNLICGSVGSVNHPVISNANAESGYVLSTIPVISNLTSHGGSGMPTVHPAAPSSTHIPSAASVSISHPVAPSSTHIPSAAGVSTGHPVVPSLKHIPNAAGVSTSHPVAPSSTHIPSAAVCLLAIQLHPVQPTYPVLLVCLRAIQLYPV
ncbi:hypothetical protein BSL78_20214 [Apostichopus japonicus]|uniref:Uncharacterized protein n=1 Tax=Stichopus japonicus TaxID=307972 RepID=A0A2G8K4K3_STIJA|nr:hypothetical protein BSL78_20214 [Apostichopus japonicus]